MAFAVKTDRCGIVAALTPSGGTANIEVRDGNLNGSNSKYQPQGQYGDFAGTDTYGEICAPSNTYGVKKGGLTVAAGTLKLNHVTTATDNAVARSFALDSFNVSTAAGSPVSVDATAAQIEAATTTDTDQDLYPLPAFTISTKQCAQDIFGAFTVTGVGCELTKCDSKASCSVSQDQIAGTLISSDCNSGVLTISGTILSRLGNVPTVAVTSGNISLGGTLVSTWNLTKAPATSETNPETAAKEYTFEVEMNLVRIRSEESAAE